MSKYLKSKNIHLPNRWFQTIGLFIFFFIYQQLITIGFNLGYILSPALGLFIGLIMIGFGLYMLWQYKISQQAVPKIKQLPGSWISWILILDVVIYSLNIAWAIFGETILKLNMHGNSSQNQQSIMSYFHHGVTPAIFMILLAIVIAPAIEEFCFRVLIIKPTKDKSQVINILRVVFSVLLFGLVHTIQQLGKIDPKIELFYYGQYCIIGLILALNYYHFRNYRLNYFLHMSWNIVSLLVALVAMQV